MKLAAILLAITVGVSVGAGYHCPDFWKMRAIEIIQVLASTAIAIVVGMYLVDRTSKKAKKRDVFYQLLVQFATQLDLSIQLAMAFRHSATDQNQRTLIRQVGVMKQLGLTVASRSEELVQFHFSDGLRDDVKTLRTALTGTPFDNKIISFPPGWETEIHALRMALLRRIYQLQFDLYS